MQSRTDELRQGARAGRGGRLSGVRVVLAEDSWIIAEAVKDVLAREGAMVTGPAATVEEARALTERTELDIGIFDMNLRGQLAKDLVVELAGRGIPVIVLSGYSLDPQIVSKVAATLEKPFDGDQLILTVLGCLGR